MKKLLVKKAGIEDTGDEARERVHLMISTREQTRAETDSLFENAKAARGRDRSVVTKLFKQTPAAQTMAPNLQAEPPKEDATPSSDPLSSPPGMSYPKTAAVDAWFEKNAHVLGMTEAQLRYPELLKVAASPVKVPVTSAKTSKVGTQPVPAQSSLSGGSA